MPGIHCGPWGYASTCQRTVPSSVLPQGLVECRLHSWGGVAACFPEKPAKLVAVLGSRSSYSSSTSISSRDCDWEVLRGLRHGWTSREACLPPLALCAVSQPHVGWAWVSGGGCPDSVVPALDPHCSIGSWQIPCGESLVRDRATAAGPSIEGSKTPLSVQSLRSRKLGFLFLDFRLLAPPKGTGATSGYGGYQIF